MFSALFLFLSVASALRNFEKKDHSLLLPYQTDGWYFYGNTTIESEYVRLTRDVKSQIGGLYCTAPVLYRDWEIHVTFHVHSSGKTLVGDGFAFWYTQTPASFGSAFGSHTKFRGLGIFFDTYANQNGEHTHQHPYISVMVNDGNKAYDHDRDGTLTELAGCSTDFRNKKNSVAIIQFVNGELSLTLNYPDEDKQVDCFKVEQVRLPTGYYFGFSAATGDLSDNHDITSIHTYEVDTDRPPEDSSVDAAMIEPSVGNAPPDRERVPDLPPPSRGSRFFLTVLYWLFILSVLCGCVYLSYVYYTRRQRQLKRLY